MSKKDNDFLNLYFQGVFKKLSADVHAYNNYLPHEGLKGGENEDALANVIRSFLPSKYGVEVNALVVDRLGKVSKQCDIVVYDNFQFPNYFRKVFPIEVVHAVIEVKTVLTKQKSNLAMLNENALRKLLYQPLLTYYWATRTKEEKLAHTPPIHCVFGYKSSTQDFGTFIKWFNKLPSVNVFDDTFSYNSPFNPFIVCSLDKGVIFCRGDGHVARWLAISEHGHAPEKCHKTTGAGVEFEVEPAKSLLFFLETLWTMLHQSPRHAGFDIRSYMSEDLSTFIPFKQDGTFDEG
ncbi:DUF6602 domain-containing protein [Vibrio alginolyticus]|uniref:DUF6602 domain-containing protein n=1 Tax=Vibrio alginolyticus TaxID=663 RepID=UPI0040689246